MLSFIKNICKEFSKGANVKPILSCCKVDGSQVQLTSQIMQAIVQLKDNKNLITDLIESKPLPHIVTHESLFALLEQDEPATVTQLPHGEKRVQGVGWSDRLILGEVYPSYNQPTAYQHTVEVDIEQLEHVLHAVDKQKNNIVLSGVAVYESGALCATDGKVLIATELNKDKACGILPANYCKLLVQSKQDKVTVLFSETMKRATCILDYDAHIITLESKLIDGVYPSWHNAIWNKQDAQHAVNIPVELIKQAHKKTTSRQRKVILFASAKDYVVFRDFPGNNWKLASHASQACLGAESFFVSFDIDYALKATKDTQDAFVTMRFASNSQGLLFGDDNKIRLVMPMVLPEDYQENISLEDCKIIEPKATRKRKAKKPTTQPKVKDSELASTQAALASCRRELSRTLDALHAVMYVTEKDARFTAFTEAYDILERSKEGKA